MYLDTILEVALTYANQQTTLEYNTLPHPNKQRVKQAPSATTRYKTLKSLQQHQQQQLIENCSIEDCSIERFNPIQLIINRLFQ